MPNSTQSSKVLLVEGTSDHHAVKHICRQQGQTPNFKIKNKESVNTLLKSISAETKTPGLEAFGILVDADDDLGSRWQEITTAFQSIRINVPANPDPSGTIIEGNPRIGIWVMPDNKSVGELEGFINTMIPSSDQVWPLSEGYIDSIPNEERKFADTDKKILKAKVHAWLAARKFPGLIGVAVREGDLSIDGQACKDFVNWLQRLFR